MSELETALAEIYHLIELASKDELDKYSVAFAIAKDIVKFKDKTILNSVSPEYASLVNAMVDTFEETGEYKIYSSVGCADHSEMVASLANILKK